ncbi:C39 family peptidase [Marinifilum flexuosum]|uniref:C39 family peptidase n=1 Tax=Marinifilum flexuosum TaxID=1117708 RepID=UPI0024953188|nr:papain-like cysteine protease family protein [Marinifilum flexuosum]
MGTFYCVPKIDKNGTWLSINVEQQKKSRWCWAAITRATGLYYETSNLSQEEIVKELLIDAEFNENLYTKSEIEEKNINFKLDVALKYVEAFSHWSAGKPSFERIQFEINQGRPFCARIEWFKSGAHYILIKGYNANQRTIFIDDPLHGFHIEKYKNFPDEYNKSGAVWTETFWTNKKETK